MILDLLQIDPFADIRSSLASLLRLVLGLAALVSLVVVIISIQQEDKESIKKASVWLVSLILGFILLEVFS